MDYLINSVRINNFLNIKTNIKLNSYFTLYIKTKSKWLKYLKIKIKQNILKNL